MADAFRVGVLASGDGTNLQALLDKVHGHRGIEIVAVGSNVADAPALRRARDGRRAGARVPRARPGRARRRAWPTGWPSAGCSSSCSPATCSSSPRPSSARFPGRVINVHPALLPAFPGIRAVEQAVAYGVKVFGVTVHFVDEGVDSGPVDLAARARAARARTTPATVRDALRPIEHELLPEAVRPSPRAPSASILIDPRRV